MDYKTIEVKRQDGITWLFFDRQEKKNAMNPREKISAGAGNF